MINFRNNQTNHAQKAKKNSFDFVRNQTKAVFDAVIDAFFAKVEMLHFALILSEESCSKHFNIFKNLAAAINNAK